MLTTAEATDRILAAVHPLDAESVPLDIAAGRVLMQSVVAERDQPPFDRVMMDGIAIAHSDFVSGQRTFEIQSMQAAGDPQESLQAGKAIDIMTGASLPNGADCIIPIERIAVDETGAHVKADYSADARQFIHAQGSDHEEGAELLTSGTRVSPMDVAIIASAGLAVVDVAMKPCVRVISTGNELVDAGKPIEAHQIRLSNGPAIVAMLEEHGFDDTEHDHLLDEPEILEHRIAEHLAAADVVVLSGGVSMGKADYVPEVLKKLGVVVDFHRISQRPGRPMWFGIGPKGQAVFALPGNPVSALVCCRHYVVTALRHMSGIRSATPQFATLTEAVTFKPKLTCFLPVRLLSNAAGQLLAMPVHTNTSGDFTALSGTDGYAELPLERSEFPTGTTVPFYRWRV